MSAAQISNAKRLAGTMSGGDIAKTLGVSPSNLKRSCGATSFAFFSRYARNPRLVAQVCRYYEKHGKHKTQERFPEISVRSIVERYKLFSPRQIRWSGAEILEATRMAGIVTLASQAKMFGRPRAYKGSIRSLWAKKFGIGPANVNGAYWHMAKNYVRPSCPVQIVNMGTTQKKSHRKLDHKLVLWVDFEKHMKPNAPDIIIQGVKALAKFQRWVHGPQVRRSVNSLREKDLKCQKKQM